MILTKKVLIKINGKQIKFYKNLGYEFKVNELIEIKIEDLPKGSHSKVLVKCDICGKEKALNYKQYNSNISKYNLYSCSEKCANFKNKLTCKEKYGNENYNNKDRYVETCIKKYDVVNPQKLDFVKNKTKQTCLMKYGYDNHNKSEHIKNKIKQTKILRKQQFPDEIKSEFMLFSSKVDNLTKKYKKYLFENWNGYDYYDGEYIKNNLDLHYNDNNYPSVDHKISKWHGYKNSMNPEEIADIHNLCITKRIINSTKNKMIESDFNI